MNLEKEIIQWAENRGIFDNPQPVKQHDKTVEEVLELRDAIVVCDFVKETFGNKPTNIDEIKDGIGDVIVTLVLIAKMHNLTIDECVKHAYDEIKDRQGKMVDGAFVKKES